MVVWEVGLRVTSGPSIIIDALLLHWDMGVGNRPEFSTYISMVVLLKAYVFRLKSTFCTYPVHLELPNLRQKFTVEIDK